MQRREVCAGCVPEMITKEGLLSAWNASRSLLRVVHCKACATLSVVRDYAAYCSVLGIVGGSGRAGCRAFTLPRQPPRMPSQSLIISGRSGS